MGGSFHAFLFAVNVAYDFSCVSPFMYSVVSSVHEFVMKGRIDAEARIMQKCALKILWQFVFFMLSSIKAKNHVRNCFLGAL